MKGGCHHAAAMNPGHDELTRAIQALAARIPQPLAGLARLAYNYRWSWTPDGPEVFAAVDPVRWERCGESPVRLLGEAGSEALERAAADARLLERIAAVQGPARAGPGRPGWDPPGPKPSGPALFA